MIDQHLINVINSGRAWAFVGSGASVDAGLPTWQGLFLGVSSALSGDATVQAPPPNALPEAFGQLISTYGRPSVISQVANQLKAKTRPGPVHRLLSAWPFAGYVTTNYDTLLDAALQSHPGWVSVGNTVPETKKISGDISNVVWHPHGMIDSPENIEKLILSKEDYDNTYPAGSLILETLKALLRMRSLVFFGFGFNDPDLAQLLELVARLSDPAQPAYAFLADSTPERRTDLRTRYNVVTIPYDTAKGSHSELLTILRHYGYFVVERSTAFGTSPSVTPSYDPEVTSLIVQNALYSGSVEVTKTTQQCVMRASVLAALSTHGPLTNSELEHHILLGGTSGGRSALERSVGLLVEEHLIVKSNERFGLTPSAADVTAQRQGQARVLFDQFLSSIRRRTTTYVDDVSDDVHVGRVSGIAAGFFQDICGRRGLAIAQNLCGGPDGHLQRRTVALVQELPKWFPQCQSLTETRALTNVVVGVLSNPAKPERIYLGLLTQAYFGKHIAGVEEESISIRRQLLSSTVFILDSHFVIALLARGSTGHDHAVELVRLLRDTDVVLVATHLILVETKEHLEWAIREVAAPGGGTSLRRAFDVVRGASGQRNSFLDGYSEFRAKGEGDSFGQYVASVLGGDRSGKNIASLVAKAVAGYGIRIDGVEEWLARQDGDEAFGQLVDVITARRQEHGSHKHDRQVLAEAQVVAFVAGVRAGGVQMDGKGEIEQAFFITDSRVLDGMEGYPAGICMTPEGLYQWLLSTKPCTPEKAARVFDHLLLELLDSGMEFVPRERIVGAFGSIVQASREQMGKLIAEHRMILEGYYGRDHGAALSQIDDLYVLDAVEFLSNTVLREQSSRLAFEQAKRLDAEKKLKVLETLQDDITRYQRRRREKQKRRAARSRPRTRRERRKERRKLGKK